MKSFLLVFPSFFLSVSAFSSSPFRSRKSTTSLDALVVVSPPGGVGEVTAVKAAEMGAAVRWFVVSQDETQQKVVLAQEALDSVKAAGGSVDLARASATSLLEDASARQAVSTWCGSTAVDAIVCTVDGVPENDVEYQNAVKLAAQQAAQSVTGPKVNVLSATEQEDDDEDNESDQGGLQNLVGNLWGGGDASVQVPSSVSRALGGPVTLLRHGQLFGLPESSPDFSPLVGGPRQQPELCEEYALRTVRVDPSRSLAGNVLTTSTTRSSRHAVGQAAALLALQKSNLPAGADICVSSQRGVDPPSLDDWADEFQRVQTELSSPLAATQLFSADFDVVPSTERLADWLATKWAPAVLRTYDIATIRSGARPVYATSQDTTVEIVWQQLVNYESVTVGKMIIEVSSQGLVATRGPGAQGSISKKPLAGEAVLVRRLAEAASQAVEKGLATKKAPKKKAPAPQPAAAATTTTIQSSGTVVAPPPPTDSSGPRPAGARRSQERTRGTRRKSTPPDSPPAAKE